MHACLLAIDLGFVTTTRPSHIFACMIGASPTLIITTRKSCTYVRMFVAERLSARHLILEYDLFERIYVCMYVCMSVTLRNAIIIAYAHAYVHSIDVLYLLPRDFFYLAGAQYV